MRTIDFAKWGRRLLPLLVCLAFGLWFFAVEKPVNTVPSFVLQSTKEGDITNKTAFDKPSALFFGFTYCPDICPTALQEMSLILDALGKDTKNLNVYFITIDPVRDTKAHLQLYLSSFHPHIIGLTGEVNELEKVIKYFGIYTKKHESEGGNYIFDHTSTTLLLNRHGVLVSTLSMQEDFAVKLEKVKLLLSRQKQVLF